MRIKSHYHLNHHNSISPIPGSFSALMEMYEVNYIRLRLLCEDIRKLPDVSTSYLADSIPVEIKILERSKHTTTFVMNYCFRSENENDHTQDTDTDRYHKRPDLHVRVYHDARQAEVVSRRCRLTGETLRNWAERGDTMLICRWRLNRFLYKWSGYLRRQGHSFSGQANENR